MHADTQKIDQSNKKKKKKKERKRKKEKRQTDGNILR